MKWTIAWRAVPKTAGQHDEVLVAVTAAKPCVAATDLAAPPPMRRAEVRGASVGNMSVTGRDNPSRQGGSKGSTDSDMCTTADAILANAAHNNRKAQTLVVVANTIRSGGGVKETPAKRTSKISRADEAEDVENDHAPRYTSDSCIPNLAKTGDSGSKWAICEGPTGAEGGGILGPGTSSYRKTRPASK